MNRVLLPPKRLGETLIVGGPNGISFLSSLGPTETILNATTTVTVWSGVDPTPGNILGALPVVSGSNVLQLVTAGVLGVIYQLQFEVNTNLPQGLVICGYLAIIPNVP